MTVPRAGDQQPQRIASFRIRLLHAGVRRKLRHGFFVRPAAAQQRPRQSKVRCISLAQVHLAADLRHAGPGVEHMRDPMRAQAGEILGRKKLGIANLHRVTKARG